MSYKTERATKQLKEKHQVILNELLREEANRYCADCEAKGPRWASWNIGVFVCIRCAGIHRNLGVHISRVKSVNLDSWTIEQIESIQKWGNKRAKEHYECYLPDDFLRPQGDSAMEMFIRNKYEKKLYIRKGGEPPPNKCKEVKAIEPKKKEKQLETSQEKLSVIAAKTKVDQAVTKPKSNVPADPYASHKLPQKSNDFPVTDLLGMENPAPTSTTAQEVDEFSLFMQASAGNHLTANSANINPAQVGLIQPSSQIPGADSLLLEEGETTKKSSTKESILSLYQCGNQQQKPVYGVPGGVYMTQQQQNASSVMQGMNKQQTGMSQFGTLMGNPSQMAVSQNPMMMNQNQMTMQQNMRMNVRNSSGQQIQSFMPNMMAIQSQMHNMNLGQGNQFSGYQNSQGNQMISGANRPQYPLGNTQANLGQMMMSNSYGSNRPVIHSQQVVLANGPPVGYAARNMQNSHNMGHTLNNQLWK